MSDKNLHGTALAFSTTFGKTAFRDAFPALMAAGTALQEDLGVDPLTGSIAFYRAFGRFVQATGEDIPLAALKDDDQ